MLSKDVIDAIRVIPDFPKPGILFRDITPVLATPSLFNEVIDVMASIIEPANIDYIAGIDSRGFFFASALAYKLEVGFIPIRKKGKLPASTYDATYELEYGTATLCVHKDAIKPNSKVVIVDDVLATGGTLNATIELIERFGIKPEFALCLMELVELKGRENLNCKLTTLMDI